MRVPLSWLKDYVDIDIPAAELATKLSGIGVPVEKVEYIAPYITNVKVGYIKAVRKHPNADKLRLCDVDFGGPETIQIVTGAPNVQEGHKVPVALHGADLANGLKIKRSKIRGEVSEGMMCSATELALDIKDLPQDQREGVLILPPDTVPGQDVTELYCLKDPIFEIESFANRPDQLSILGIAREVAALLGKPLKTPLVEFSETGDKVPDHLTISIQNYDLCKKYSGRIIRQVPVGPAPLWMQGRLYAAGIRSINNVVDVTNYVMVETGQPLHAFDYDKVKGKRIIVRSAAEGEKIMSIDGKERDLDPSMLVIADEKDPVAIAGVMGGLESEVSDTTTAILLESANFNPASIRRTSIKLGLRSESSRRFEKGIDFYQVDFASRRTCHFLQAMGGTVMVGEAVDCIEPPKPATILLRPARVNKVLGTNLDREDIKKLLAGLHFTVADQDENLLVTVPTVRQDITVEIELVEEVARLYGYDNIPTTSPQGVALGSTDPEIAFDDHLRELAARCGLYECITLSMYDRKTMDTFNINDEKILSVKNPITEDQEYMRSNAVSHLVETVKRNMAVKRNVLRLFEISKFYTFDEGEILERRELTILLTGPKDTPDVDFFALKGIVGYILDTLRIPVEFNRAEVPYLHPGKTARISSDNKPAGVMGVLDPRIAASLEIDQEIVVARLFIGSLRLLAGHVEYKPISRFQGVQRDLAVLVDAATPAGDVEKIILEFGKPFIDEAYCFDVYQGKQIPDGKKSLAFSLGFSNPERTLTDQDIQSRMDEILAHLQKELNATLRS